jgi:UDP-2-acetamido-2-deoxy-ribo-hexuluronate aminotransferase
VKFIDLERQYQRYREGIDKGMREVVESAAFIMGRQVDELEAALAAWVGVRHAVGVSSGTDALLLPLMALGVGPGDEVVTTPFTFIATAEVIALLGAKPVFVDIDPVTGNIDPAGVGAALTPRTKAVIPVSLYGQAPDMEAINALAAPRGITVIEDGCQSFGATRHGRRSGALSAVGTTSFFPSKPLGCYGDGGMIFTDDEALAKAMREIRVHGQDRRYHHARIGVNARLDTLQAAVLLAKFPHFEEEISLRARAGERYNRLLGAIPGVTVPVTAPGNTHVYAQYSIRVADREGLAAHLKGKGIPTAVHYPIPLHLQPAFGGIGLGEGAFPVAEEMARRIISLPMHPFLEDGEIDRVAAAVAEFQVGSATGA